MKLLTAATLLLASSTVVASPAPLVSIASHDAFFSNIAAHCGKAYEGKVSVDTLRDQARLRAKN